MRSFANFVLLLLCGGVISQKCNDLETDCYAPWQCVSCDTSLNVGKPVGTLIKKFCSTPRASFQDPGYYKGDFCDGSKPSCTCDEKVYRPLIAPYDQVPARHVPERQAPEIQAPVRQVPGLATTPVQVPKKISPPTEAPSFGRFHPAGDQPFTFPPGWNPAPPRRRPNIFHDNLSNVALILPDQLDQGDQADQGLQFEGIDPGNKDILGVNQGLG